MTSTLPPLVQAFSTSVRMSRPTYSTLSPSASKQLANGLATDTAGRDSSLWFDLCGASLILNVDHRPSSATYTSPPGNTLRYQ
ncbi:hypothetical protein FIBSPDRAFT_250978 [Athelia psychrophila]|uniref:Uncharacterized protein n=1 Tax=Athelia psychrophila TaxID=1759441 RepID=A0A165XV55_9AGAM|nr:hypothetical protein FIBSPDRAFT_250978 [Fibularhizoctonia sp. CBS 109695]